MLKLVDVVQAELKSWRDGGWVECVRHPATKKPVGSPDEQPGSLAVARYWREGIGNHSLNGCINEPWSAAFICWCLRKAGVELENFPFSPGHHAYIRWAINNAKKVKPGKLYYGERVQAYAPRPGDIIAQWRKAKESDPDPDITFDRQPDDFYPAHCDIVVTASADKVVVVGGNVGDRVKESTFAAVQGVLVPRKALICVMRLAKPI